MLAAAALVNLSELTDVELEAPVARTSDSADPDARRGGKASATATEPREPRIDLATSTRCPQVTISCGADIA